MYSEMATSSADGSDKQSFPASLVQVLCNEHDGERYPTAALGLREKSRYNGDILVIPLKGCLHRVRVFSIQWSRDIADCDTDADFKAEVIHWPR